MQSKLNQTLVEAEERQFLIQNILSGLERIGRVIAAKQKSFIDTKLIHDAMLEKKKNIYCKHAVK